MSTSFPAVTAVRNVRPWGGEASDILIDGSEITQVVPATDAPIAETEIDGRGLLAIPGLVNTHAHVDKSWWGHPWQSYGGEGGTDGRIRHERARRDELGIPSVEITSAVLAESVKTGTTEIRTHVDVDLGLGLRGIEAVREAVATYDGALACEIIAFPQDGVLRRPGVLALLEDAAKAGVEHIGGLDPAGIDRDPVGQIDAILGLAAEYGTGVDIHLHDGGSLGAFQFDLIIDRTRTLGLQGKVNIAHGFAIVDQTPQRRAELLAQMAELDITMTTVAPVRMTQFGLHEFDDAGVRFGFGTDGIRDLWSPYGTGDLMGIAWQYARGSGIVRDEDLLRVVQLATSAAAPFAGVAQNDLATGSRADVVLIDAENPMDALVRTLPRERVIGGGKLLFTR
ncbi:MULTISPECIES: amidohydrolase family protein [unclassified Microbacterium]|uniref:amidohydrolase family protein n=1 Tax=unclassified Microbacterium TaxID=2609290 RepID=UPI0012FC3092|nr:amidohydrolase family protein [Microbacterium sp. MAH-37]MVQ44092.1 amidohydrolase family protein [Microbacterium sp. MAH-37]